MRKIKYILSILIVLSFASCEQVQVPTDFDDSYVSFYDPNGEYRQCIQSKQVNFFYMNDNVTRDTVWLKLVAKGAVPTKDCQIKIAQCYPTSSTLLDMSDAKAGVQYVPFDSDGMKNLLKFHKGQLYDSIPIILLRDTSLKSNSYRIAVRLENSDDIKATDQRADSISDFAFAAVYIADGLSQPSSWNMWFFLGSYGKVKHDFCIRHSGERWDDTFINSLDENEEVYYLYKFRNDLIDENAQRQAEGLSVLSEANGMPVTFPTSYN